MAASFGLKIGVEGEKEFKSALKDINQCFKVLASEMNLVSSQFDENEKSVKALDSTYIQLEVGANLFRYDAVTNIASLEVSMSFCKMTNEKLKTV